MDLWNWRVFFERFPTYDSVLRNVLRDACDFDVLMRRIEKENCSDCRGAEGKIARDLDTKDGYDYADSECSLRETLRVGGDLLNQKGMCANTESESLLRERTGVDRCMR